MQFSESAIYRHFSSKEEIIITLLKYLNETVNKIFKESSASGDFEKDFLMFAARVKHPGFKEENEWRLILTLDETKNKYIF